ncbi:hypothetical protein NDI39_29635 [Microcoleus sp. ZQ-A2]|nr:hypothetical protein [Microcoleus sp. FACHB-1]
MSNKRDQINFRLDPGLSQALQSKCEELGITKTEFAKRALKSALGQPLDELPVKPLKGILENIEERFAKLEERMFYFEQRLGEPLA